MLFYRMSNKLKKHFQQGNIELARCEQAKREKKKEKINIKPRAIISLNT